MIRRVTIAALVLGLLAGAYAAEEEKKDPKDPLSKYSDEDLAEPGIACQHFFKAIADGEAEVVQAFLEEVPKNLANLDLKKDADRETFLKAFASYKGCHVVASQRIAMAGLAQIRYDKDGTEKTLRMRNVGGRWKWVGD